MPAADRVEHTARNGLRAKGDAAAQPRAAGAAQPSAAVPDAAMRPSPSLVRWLARSSGAYVSGAAGLCGKLVRRSPKEPVSYIPFPLRLEFLECSYNTKRSGALRGGAAHHHDEGIQERVGQRREEPARVRTGVLQSCKGKRIERLLLQR